SCFVFHILILFFFQCYGDHRDLHSFPTRRSSDLVNVSINSRTVKWFLLAGANVGSRILEASNTNRRRRCGTLKSRVFTIFQDSRSEEHTSELQSPYDLVCRLLLEKKKKKQNIILN